MSYFGECVGGPECAAVYVAKLACQAWLDQYEHSTNGGTQINPQTNDMHQLFLIVQYAVCPRTRRTTIEKVPHWWYLLKNLPLREREVVSELIRRELARPAAVLQSSGSSGSWHVPQLR